MSIDSLVHSNQPISPGPGQIGVPVEESGLEVRQLLDLLRAGRKVIFLVTACTFVLAVAYCFLVSPTYRADGLVQIEQNSSKGGGLNSQLSELSALVLGSPVETQAEIEVLRSRMVLGQVVDQLNLEISATPRSFPVIGKAIIRANQGSKAPVAVPSFLRSYAWGGESIVVPTLDVPEAYLGKRIRLTKTAEGFSIRVPDEAEMFQGKIGESTKLQTAEGQMTIFVRELQAADGTSFNLVRYSRQNVLGQLSQALKVFEQGKQSGVVAISYSGASADYVTRVINTLEECYLRQNVERRSATAEQSLEYLEKQLPTLKEKVNNAQLQLNNYQSAHGSVDVTQETELVLKKTVSLDSQRLQLQQQREELMQRFTPQHPAIKAIDQQLESLDAARARAVEQVQKLPNTQQDIFSLMRDLEVSNELYAQMLNSIQQLQVAKAGTVGNVRIVDPALKPMAPTSPRTVPILALSIVVGLFLGIAIVFGQRALLRGVDDPAELESRLGLVTYAMIPFSTAQKQLTRKFQRDKDAGHSILAAIHGNDLAIEALRSLRTSLQFALLEARNNVIMLTGPAPGLGKSFVSLNLAAVLALSGKKVAVVDCDLRRGFLHTYISSPATPGLSDYIAGKADLASIIHHGPVEGLDLILRGNSPPNPAELLMHERFADLVERLSSQYEYVIVDTPPVLAVADAAIVGRLAGSTLLVLKSAEHSMREIEDTVKRLVTAGINVKGVLFNQVGIRAGSYGYGNYGYSYYRYESET